MNKINIYNILFLVTILSSCATTAYIPKVHVSKKFKGANDFHASVSSGSNIFNLGLAYTPINHIYIHGTIGIPKIYDFDEIVIDHQFGLGYYSKVKKLYTEIELGYNKANGMPFEGNSKYLFEGKHKGFFGSFLIEDNSSNIGSAGFGVQFNLTSYDFLYYKLKKQKKSVSYKPISFANQMEYELFGFFTINILPRFHIFGNLTILISKIEANSTVVYPSVGIKYNFRKKD
jgi:hypothetical protein